MESDFRGTVMFREGEAPVTFDSQFIVSSFNAWIAGHIVGHGLQEDVSQRDCLGGGYSYLGCTD